MKQLFSWLVAHRTSPRVAFVLRTGCMLFGMLFSLYWSRSLLHGLGAENFGLWASFGAFLALAGAGELGLGGAVGLRTAHLLAEGKLEELRQFQAVARASFLVVSVTGAALVLALSPWLPGWLHFEQGMARGSLVALFAVAAPSYAFGVYTSYLANSSYNAGTVTWDILPNFLLVQANLACLVMLSRLAVPLWFMQVCSLVFTVLGLRVLHLIYRHSHPVYGNPLPLRFEGRLLGELVRSSGWVYLFGLALLVYTATDRLIINATFGAAAVSIFTLNGRLTELALSVVISAAYVALPKIVRMMLTSHEREQHAGVAFAVRLGRLQSFLGLAGALIYLLVNEYFIRWLYGAAFVGPFALQAAFGTIFILSANTDIYLQLGGRLSHAGLRIFGCAVFGAALVNFSLSLVAARFIQWMPGVAWATVAAQIALYFFVSQYVRRRHHFGSFRANLLRTFALPLGLFALACFAKLRLIHQGATHPVLLAGIVLGLIAVHSLCAGPGPKELFQEWRSLLEAFGRRRRDAGPTVSQG